MRKIISMFLFVLLLICNVSYAVGIDGFTSPLENAVIQCLQHIELQKEVFQMEDVNFSEVYLGNSIPSFIVERGKYIKQSDVKYYPLLENDEWVATATVSYASDGTMNVQVSRDFIDEYVLQTKNANINNKVALVFSDELYISVNDNYRNIVSSAKTFYDDLDIVQGEEIYAVKKINFNSIINNTRSSGQLANLAVPQEQQPSSNSCWATCIVSIMKHYGYTQTVQQVYTKSGTAYNTMQSTQVASNTLNAYGYETGVNKQTQSMYYRDVLIMDNLITELYFNESPIFAGFKYSSGTAGHAVVIQGYLNTSTNKTFSYMDPASGTYKSSVVPTNGSITIVNSNSVTLQFASGFAVYAD